MSFQLASISESDLLGALPTEFAAMLREFEMQGHSIDEIAEFLAANTASQFGVGDPTSTSEGGLLARMKDEFRCLICTDDLRYSQVRMRIGKESGVAGALVLSLISSSISVHLGLEAGLCMPFVALLLLAIIRTGKEAWCNCTPSRQNHEPVDRLFEIKCRQLRILEVQAVHYGFATPPHITIEIEDLKAEISRLTPARAPVGS